MSYAEYLERERVTGVRHEWLRGEVWAMAGGTPDHSGIAANVIQELGLALRGRPCRAYTSDLKLRGGRLRQAAGAPDRDRALYMRGPRM